MILIKHSWFLSILILGICAVIVGVTDARTIGGSGQNNEIQIPGNIRVINENKDFKKGVVFSEELIFRKNLISQSSSITTESNILLDYTVITGTIYTATQNRGQATFRETELSDVTDFYVGWFWWFCGQERTITAYSPSVDEDDVVIGRFTLESNFDTEPANGANIKLINPNEVDSDVRKTVIQETPGGQVNIGGDGILAAVHDNEDGFIKYTIKDTTGQAFPLGLKPNKTDSVNVSIICFPFAPSFAFQDPFLTKFGIFLDSVPANTKGRVFILGIDDLDVRYPMLENVTLDEFNQGLGDDLIVSTFADTSTWNFMQFSDPTVVKLEEQYNLVFSFSDENGDPRFLDVPVDTSFTDFGFFRTVRSDEIQSASGTAITLDTGTSPRDDDYNGMRLYIGGEFRNITNYNGTTKVATVASTYTISPSPLDDYDIKIAFISPMTIFEFRDTTKGKIQDKHNSRELTVSDDGSTIEIGTINYVNTIGGTLSLNVPIQSFRYVGASFDIIDKENNFDINPVTISFAEGDEFEGSPNTDFIADEKGVRYRFRYTDDHSFAWTVEKFNVKTYGEMYQFDQSNSISIDASDTWYEIDGMSGGETNNIIFQNGNELKITDDGEYMANYNICWTDGTGTIYKFTLAINGAIQGKTQSLGRRGTANDIVCSGSQSILSLSIDDVVTVETLNATNTNDITIMDANVNLHKLRD